MRTLLKATFAMLAIALLVGLGTTFANPTGPTATSADLDRPVSAFDAASNETGENGDDDTPPGENNDDPPPPEIFGEPVPGRKLLFIIDRSCSMGGSAWTKLTTELKNVLDALAQNNAQLKQTWQDNGQQGPEPKIEIALASYHSYGTVWKTTLTEANTSGVSSAKAWVDNNGPTGSTNWTDGFRESKVFGGVFDTIYFMSDGMPNTESHLIDQESSALAALHANKSGGTVFIAQYFSSYGYDYGRSRMQQLKTDMGGKTNIEARFSDASN